MKRRIKVANGIKADSQLTFRWRGYPGLSRWVQCGGGRQKKRVKRKCDCGRNSQRGVTLLDLKMEEGPTSQGKWLVVEAGKSKEINSRTSRREYGPTDILILAKQDMC